MPFEKDENELGALWAKTSGKGVEYLSGTIEGVGDVVCFAAKPTASGKGPTWRVLKSQPKGERESKPSRRYEGKEDESGW
jgi:uncharacterized protein (DUF736 family)